MDNKILQHYGVLGMRWGVRKSKLSSDHTSYSQIKKKKLRDMTNDEIRTIAKRAKLLKKARAATLATSKNPKNMSNEELQGVINRDRIRREALKSSRTDVKGAIKNFLTVGKMSDADVKKLFDRVMLEKTISGISKEDMESARILIDEMILKP